MDLRTNYLGFQLSHPVIPGASPLTFEIDLVKGLIDAGAPMLILRSLFEEDIRLSNQRLRSHNDHMTLQTLQQPIIEPADYLNRLEQIKNTSNIPIVASINGTTPGSWLKFATHAINAGADAIELNIYRIASEPDLSSDDIEAEDIHIISELSKRLTVPLAVKISRNYTSLTNYAEAIHEAGAQSLVIFNRFLQPDIDIENRTLSYRLTPSTHADLLPRLRWAAILSSRVKLPLAITGGIQNGHDIIKSILCGASVCQVVTPLIDHGSEHLNTIVQQVHDWCEEHQIDNLDEIRGRMNLEHASDPRAYERGNYMQMLKNAANAVTYTNYSTKKPSAK